MRFKRRTEIPWKKKARKGFQGYPVATVAFYGPDNQRATKIAACIVESANAEPSYIKRWIVEEGDIRNDNAIGREVLRFIQEHGARSVVATDGLLGCPHEEGVDYPEGEVCPKCPYWAHRDRWSGEEFQ